MSGVPPVGVGCLRVAATRYYQECRRLTRRDGPSLVSGRLGAWDLPWLLSVELVQMHLGGILSFQRMVPCWDSASPRRDSSGAE